jgi:hypothetical protein
MAWPSPQFIDRVFRSDVAPCALDNYDITPSDSANLPVPVRALRANTAGNIKLVTARGSTRTCRFAAGETRLIAATKVFQTDTTCTGIEGMV